MGITSIYTEGRDTYVVPSSECIDEDEAGPSTSSASSTTSRRWIWDEQPGIDQRRDLTRACKQKRKTLE